MRVGREVWRDVRRQLGNDVGFIGKISDDDLGQKYEEGLKKEYRGEPPHHIPR